MRTIIAKEQGAAVSAPIRVGSPFVIEAQLFEGSPGRIEFSEPMESVRVVTDAAKVTALLGNGASVTLFQTGDSWSLSHNMKIVAVTLENYTVVKYFRGENF